jgi:excisionase family DNA binding protein
MPDRSPDLPLLLADPRRAADVSADDVPALLGELERLKAILWQRLLNPSASQAEPAPTGPLDDLRQLTPAQVSELLNLKEPYIHELCRTGRLPATKSGQYWMISVAGLRQWLVYPGRDIDGAARARLESLNPRGDSGPPMTGGRRPRRSVTSA